MVVGWRTDFFSHANRPIFENWKLNFFVLFWEVPGWRLHFATLLQVENSQPIHLIDLLYFHLYFLFHNLSSLSFIKVCCWVNGSLKWQPMVLVSALFKTERGEIADGHDWKIISLPWAPQDSNLDSFCVRGKVSF